MPEKSVTNHLALVHNVPPRIRLVTIVFVTNLLIFLFLRLGFLFVFIPDKVKQYYPLLADYYGIEGTERTKLSLERSCSPLPRLKGTPNLVFIIMETFAGFKMGVVNDGLDSSPNFDKLSG